MVGGGGVVSKVASMKKRWVASQHAGPFETPALLLHRDARSLTNHTRRRQCANLLIQNVWYSSSHSKISSCDSNKAHNERISNARLYRGRLRPNDCREIPTLLAVREKLSNERGRCRSRVSSIRPPVGSECTGGSDQGRVVRARH